MLSTSDSRGIKLFRIDVFGNVEKCLTLWRRKNLNIALLRKEMIVKPCFRREATAGGSFPPHKSSEKKLKGMVESWHFLQSHRFVRLTRTRTRLWSVTGIHMKAITFPSFVVKSWNDETRSPITLKHPHYSYIIVANLLMFVFILLPTTYFLLFTQPHQHNQYNSSPVTTLPHPSPYN